MIFDPYILLQKIKIIWMPAVFVSLFIFLCLIVWLWGRLFFRNDYNRGSGQVKPFNSGNIEEIDYPVPSSSLYWGFRKVLGGYYDFMQRLHNGDLNDYLKWMIIFTAVCFMLILGGLL